jgi:hypothetical protein
MKKKLSKKRFIYLRKYSLIYSLVLLLKNVVKRSICMTCHSFTSLVPAIFSGWENEKIFFYY